MNKLTQQQRILELLQQRGEVGVYVYEMQTPRPRGLGVAQYNARIKELRNILKKKGDSIINTKPGHFVLTKNPSFQEEVKPQYKWVFEGSTAKQVLVNQEPIQQQMI